MIKRKALIETIASNLNGFLKKNNRKFVSSGQKVPASEPDRTSSLRQSNRLSNSTASAKPQDKIPFETGQARITSCKE